MIITDKAAERIAALATTPDMFLRIAVHGGGCSGFQYQIFMDNALTDDDQRFNQGDASVVIDDISLSLLQGSILDYQENLMASKFVITNPNATAGCGCGKSFAL